MTRTKSQVTAKSTECPNLKLFFFMFSFWLEMPNMLLCVVSLSSPPSRPACLPSFLPQNPRFFEVHVIDFVTHLSPACSEEENKSLILKYCDFSTWPPLSLCKSQHRVAVKSRNSGIRLTWLKAWLCHLPAMGPSLAVLHSLKTMKWS